jgi:hypothetical protein
VTLALVLLAVAAALVAWRGRLWLGWWSLRRRLLAEARARGLEGAWRRGSIKWFSGLQVATRRNLELRATVDGRAITATPQSLGWRRELPPFTWWTIILHPLATDPAAEERLPNFVAQVRRREPGQYQHPQARSHTSGDAAFDAELEAYRFELDEPEANRCNALALESILASAPAREMLRALLVGPTDDVSLHGGGLHLSVRRTGASIEDLQARLEQATRLADAIVAALDRSGVYR